MTHFKENYKAPTNDAAILSVHVSEDKVRFIMGPHSQRRAVNENGDHQVFVSGNDAKAKAQVVELLKSFGWIHIMDLGDLRSARGTEMYLRLWVRL